MASSLHAAMLWKGEPLEEIVAQLLAQMRPTHFVDTQASWQKRKSQEMRVRILECTLECLVTKGYSELSTNDVVQMAAVSRGAMHHHFPTREKLISALIEYVFYRRMENFLNDYIAMLNLKGDKADVEAASETYWQSLHTREFTAYLQLAIAARTNDELNAAFLPASRKYDRVWAKEMVKYFPQWKDHLPALKVANDLAVVAFMGLLIHEPIFGNKRRIERVRKALVDMIRMLQAGAMQPAP